MSDAHPDLEVWTDGACPLCQRARAWTEARDQNASIVFHDFRTTCNEELPQPLSELEGQLWVRAADGRLGGGFAGWLLILGALDRWRWLARLASRPPLRWLGPLVYRVVARYRFVLGRPWSEPRE